MVHATCVEAKQGDSQSSGCQLRSVLLLTNMRYVIGACKVHSGMILVSKQSVYSPCMTNDASQLSLAFWSIMAAIQLASALDKISMLFYQPQQKKTVANARVWQAPMQFLASLNPCPNSTGAWASQDRSGYIGW